jgi:Putative metal-binding motif
VCLTAQRLVAAGAVLLASAGFSACGARTGLELNDGGVAKAAVACATDADCDGNLCSPAQCQGGVCVALPAKECNDDDPCTTDTCDPTTGACVSTSLTQDLDGDGYKGPLPGLVAGVPGSCGDDCNDHNANVHPGAAEVCNGIDDNCNGVIDEGLLYSPSGLRVRVSSPASDRAERGGLAFDGKQFGASYSGHRAIWDSYFQGLSGTGASTIPETRLSNINSDTHAGVLVHNGSYFATAWSDARQDANYEVYFNRIDSNGKRLGPDLRITNAPNFSVNASLAWTGTEFLTVWDDRRLATPTADDVRLFGQRIDFAGNLLGGNVELTPGGVAAEYPAIALGTAKLGVVFASQSGTSARGRFFAAAKDFSNPGPIVDVSETDVQGPQITFVGGSFVIVWGRYSSGPGASIYAATVDEQGRVLVPERAITSGATFARTFGLLSFGDRFLLVWADDRDQPGVYQLSMQFFAPDLAASGTRLRVTTTAEDTLSPALSFGPSGVGVLYDDWLPAGRQTYFTAIGCKPNGLP